GVIQRYPLVKEEMLLFIKNDFKQCINLSIFREEGMSIDAKEPKFEIILADSGTNFYIDYPLDVSMGDYSERISKIPAYKSEISLKRMYEIARNVIYEDKTNLLFPLESITVNEYRYNPLYPAVAISVIPGKDYDIIKLTDLKRKIEGKQYELIFLRQNRNPVLKYIPEINGLISSPISVSPLAFDPDEDDFNITIEKWKIELGNVVFVPTRIIVYETFIPQPEDVGVYYYNITVTDSAGLSDWQNGIRATITCKYIDIKTEQAARKPYGNWSVSGKEYTYNPNCCDSYNNLFFTSSLYNELGDYLCSCTENGDCIIPGATPTPTPATGSCTKDFCNGNRASHCSTAGLVEYETQCVNGCVDGKCACIGCGDEGCYASGGCKPETSCPCVYGGSSPTCCL
ncbi:MAG: hypothetical protein NTV63_03565, partial [Candidatus Woesearchaeota archaeon]|nr:hypothetical protein [Candidatus Woesearchaeota archaeon]